MKRVAFALLMATAALVMRADQGINQKKGFNADNVYHANDIDTINAFNGNLMVTVPIGQRFPLADGLSYGFTAVSNGNVWDPENLNDPPDTTTDGRSISTQAEGLCDPMDGVMFAHPHRRANAGLGWIVTLGRLLDPGTPIGEPMSEWTYESPDGADHKFGAGTDGTITADGSNLRLRVDTGAQTRTIEFPDGSKHIFKSTTMSGLWLPIRIENQFSAFLTIDYRGPGDIGEGGIAVPAGAYQWILNDSHGRHHVVKFIKFAWEGSGRYLVDQIELAAFNNTVATYKFRYTQRTIGRQDWSEKCTGYNVNATIQTLDSIEFPDDPSTTTEGLTKYSFVYDNRTDWLGPAGSLTQATLPTGARIQWSYSQYAQARFNAAAPTPWIDMSWGVGTRKLLPRVGFTGPTLTWEYFYILNADYDPATEGDNDEWVHQGRALMRDPLGNQTLSFFSSFVCDPVSCDGSSVLPYFHSEYGKPFTREFPDGGMFLSEVQYPPGTTLNWDNPLAGAIRAKYVRYQSDFAPRQSEPDDENWRLEATRVKHFNLDGTTEHSDTVNSNWDGFGHYRVTEASGSTTTKKKKSTTNYNPHLTPTTVIPLTKPWLLNTFSTIETEYDGQISKVEACFEKDSGGVYPKNGFMLRKRTFRGGVASKDLLAVYTATAEGNVASEKFYGGDFNSLSDPSNTCGMSLGTAPYTLNHWYSFGVRSQSQYAGFTFKPLDLTIDRTGLASSSRDTAGVVTAFEYNPAGQLRRMIPPEAWTEYSYNVDPTATPPALVTVKQWPSTTTNPGSGDVPLTEARHSYDASGRLVQQATWLGGMAAGAGGATRWAVSSTSYDELGRKSTTSVPISRTSGAFTTVIGAVTQFTYDALGRVTKVRQPDGSEVTTAYPAPSKPVRTSQVQSQDANGVDASLFVSTKEEYDPFGRLTKVIENFGGINPISTDYKYDEGDRLVEVTAGVQDRLFSYDGAGLLTSETHPENGTTTYLYDARGHVKQQTAASNVSVVSSYDTAERLTSLTHNGNPLKSFTYDSAAWGLGKIASATRVNDHGTVGTYTVTETFEYAPVTGRVAAKTTEVVKVRNSVVESTTRFRDGYQYDQLGANTFVTYPECQSGCGALPPLNRTVENVYSQGLLKNVPGYTGNFTYHPNGLVFDFTRINVGGGVGPKYQQDIVNGLPRPSAINVTGYCTDLTIDTQPDATKTVSPGAPANLTVAATGETSYQWFVVGSSTVIDTDDTLSVPVNQTTSYFVRVKNGTCSIDSRVSVVSVSVPSPTVATGTATSVAQTTATLNGTVNPNGSSVTASFEYGTTTSYGSTTPGQTLSGSSSQAISAPVSSLACGTTYHFRAKASNAAGPIFGGDQTFVTSACTQTPPTVTTGSATSVSQTGATLNGTVNPNGNSTTTAFEYGTTTSYGSEIPAQTLSGSSSQPISAFAPGLTCNTTYHFRARASNGGGLRFGADAIFVTTACPQAQPTVVTGAATSITQTSASLNGTVNPNGATATTAFDYGFTTAYGSVATGPTKSGSSSQSISASAPGLTCGSTYHYRARATNSGGTGFGGDQTFATASCSASPCTPNSIAVPASLTASLTTTSCTQNPRSTATNETHYSKAYSFSGTVGQTVMIDMTSSLDTYLYLVAPNGLVAAENDDVDGTLNSRIVFALTSSGTWTIHATTYWAEAVGSYQLSIDQIACPSAEVSGNYEIQQGASQVITAALTGTAPWTVTWQPGNITQSNTSGTASLTVTPAATTHYTISQVTDATGCSTPGTGEAVVTVIPPAPTSLSAIATTSSIVSLTWAFSGNADDFAVDRCAAACSSPSSWVEIATTFNQGFADGSRTPNTSYLYRVRARKGGTSSLPSSREVATTIVFGADVVAGSLIDDANVLQLRTAIQAMSALAGMSPPTFTGVNLADVVILSVHLGELRTALATARTNLGLTPVVYSPASLEVRAIDINELRGGVR